MLVEQCGELLRREPPVALGHELTDLLPVGTVREPHPNAARAGSRGEERAADIQQGVALAWVGRGDFSAEEWGEAVKEARERRKGPTSEYLLGIPLLASFLEDGLEEFGESCEGYAADRQ